MKRFLDIVCAALGLIVLLPLLCPLAILLRMTGEGKVFYRQERMGFGLKPFFILKFATMLENSPSLGSGDITLKNDPRVLPVGRVLRKTKINELPQLWNVLIGEMSLVGPRPLTRTSSVCTARIPRQLSQRPIRALPASRLWCFGMKSGFLPGVQIRGNIILRFCCRERQGSNPGIRKTGLF